MVTFPNVKINLGLFITEKRADGYHNIESCFYPVGWEEILEIIPSDQTSFESTGIPIPGNPNENLCLKAYQLLKADFDLPPVHIHLHKVIPIGAGLGGGSADGACTLKLLNELFELGISVENLQNYAGKLGSDCPFFIENKAVLARGTGNDFSGVQLSLKSYWLLLVNPGIHISTAEAYRAIVPKKPAVSIEELLGQPPENWKGKLTNDFESSLLPHYPQISELKEKLYASDALYASMTGSGSTVYGIFKEKPSLKVSEGYSVWIGEG